MYLAYTAPHWPLQALPEDIKKYEDTYKVGWEAIRNARYERQKQLGIFPGMDNFLSERQFNDKWEDNVHAEWDARAMAVHAAMIDEQLKHFIHLSNLYPNYPQIRLAEQLLELTKFDKAFFCNSGTEANEGAIKLARKYRLLADR
jgi:hypothetical protein